MKDKEREQDFKHSLPIQIRFGDIDALGHINNNIYYSYFDLGKSMYFEEVKADAVTWTDGVIVLARSETDFILPVYYREHISVVSKITHLGDKSGVFIQQIRNTDTGEIKCECKSVFVAFDKKSRTSMVLPQEWRDAISKYEGKDL